MNILISSNYKYLKPLMVMLYSLSKNTKEEVVNAYFMNVTLTEKQIEAFENKVSKIKNIKLNIIQINVKDFEGLPLVSHISVETYARLLLLKVSPKEADRILWLDADIVINNNIDDFYNQDLKGNYAAVCQSINKNPEELLKNLDLDLNQKYFNAGVILFNLKELRKKTSEDMLLDYARENFKRLKWLDQDVLNATIGANCKFVDYKKYNMMHFSNPKFSKEELDNIKNESVVLHYIGPIKPWDYNFVGETKKIWSKWASKSGYYNKIFFVKDKLLSFIFKTKKYLARKIKKFIKSLLNIKYKSKCKKVKILTTEQTIEYIIENKASAYRFGDGEMAIIDNEFDIGFQKKDQKLSKHLHKVLQTKTTQKCLNCIPRWIFKKEDLNKRTQRSKNWCKTYLLNHISNWCNKIDVTNLYGDTSFNRNYIGLENKKEAVSIFNKLKEIWKDRDVCFIEGNLTFLGVGNDLFDSAKSIKRIIAPAKNAYSKFDEIIKSGKKLNKDTLFLVALGPTATVVCYELSKLGYQAIDIGHIDVEYEWCKMQAKEVVQLKNKFTNEAGGAQGLQVLEDETYKNQIIDNIE